MVVIILSWLFPQLYRTPFVFFFFMLLLFPWSSLSFLVSGFHNQLLSYWIVNTIRYKLKQTGETCFWTEIVQRPSTQKAVTT